MLSLFPAAPAPAADLYSLHAHLENKLHYQSPSGWFRTKLGGLLDLEGYTIDQRPPGLLFSRHDFLFNPRLSLFLDTQFGSHFYSLVQVRFDRGFDPGVMPDGDIRFDEYLLRWTPFDDARLNVQVGKFATVFGNWVPRHDSWQNPLITAPLAYENVTTISDGAAPASPAAFLARRSTPDAKGAWLPVLWGPVYASGGSVFGSVEKFDYAFDFKNASLSSHPFVWDATDLGWENPVVSGRVGHRPNAAWNVGASFSYGAYLLPSAAATLPAGKGRGDYRQITVGQDVSFAWHHWQVWAEAIASRFEVPNVGDADTLTYFIEARYKIAPNLFAAARWNQQFFDKVPDGAGGRQRWDQDLWRMDLALGYRFNRHVQVKVQYSYSHQHGPLQQGEQLLATQVTLKF
ncbi:MAG: hypothetical protein HZA89_08415 [Verrucomicrobia bacterium]|nr:hypothetical protein [Verrucomicrobiota bacterium]